MMHKDNDAALLEDCKRGDRMALASLVRRYERLIYNAAFRMLGNPDEAADVTQTVFLKTFEHLDRFNPKYKFFSWIYRIAVNESIDQLNRRNRVEPLANGVASADRGPEAAVEAKRLVDELQAALMTLNESHRAVIVLRHFTELSYRQIGEVLEIPAKTVKSRLFTARQKLRESLERQGIFSS
jgi:RNA polymerase sigma-70 factor (ECF subfamily)